MLFFIILASSSNEFSRLIGFAGSVLMAQHAGPGGNLFGMLQGIGLLISAAALFALSGMLAE